MISTSYELDFSDDFRPFFLIHISTKHAFFEKWDTFNPIKCLERRIVSKSQKYSYSPINIFNLEFSIAVHCNVKGGVISEGIFACSKEANQKSLWK